MFGVLRLHDRGFVAADPGRSHCALSPSSIAVSSLRLLTASSATKDGSSSVIASCTRCGGTYSRSSTKQPANNAVEEPEHPGQYRVISKQHRRQKEDDQDDHQRRAKQFAPRRPRNLVHLCLRRKSKNRQTPASARRGSSPTIRPPTTTSGNIVTAARRPDRRSTGSMRQHPKATITASAPNVTCRAIRPWLRLYSAKRKQLLNERMPRRYPCSSMMSTQLSSRLRQHSICEPVRNATVSHTNSNGRGGGIRTHNPRFWRPVLCQLSYAPGASRERRSSEHGVRILIRRSAFAHSLLRSIYSTIFVTTPEPTVLPPSRMAKRTPSSMAIGFDQLDARSGRCRPACTFRRRPAGWPYR